MDKQQSLRKYIREEIIKMLKESPSGPLTYTVRWTDRNYTEHKKVFKDDPKGAPENGLIKAKKYMQKLTDEDAKHNYGLYRSINLDL